MKCTECKFEYNCNIRKIAKDITGCEGHSRKINTEDEVRCMYCKEWVHKSKAYEPSVFKGHYICIRCQ